MCGVSLSNKQLNSKELDKNYFTIAVRLNSSELDKNYFTITVHKLD